MRVYVKGFAGSRPLDQSNVSAIVSALKDESKIIIYDIDREIGLKRLRDKAASMSNEEIQKETNERMTRESTRLAKTNVSFQKPNRRKSEESFPTPVVNPKRSQSTPIKVDHWGNPIEWNDEPSQEKWAFISRHKPTEEQFRLTNDEGIILVPIGDMDAFTITSNMVAEKGEFTGVVVVHPAAALRLQSKYKIGIFENANRAPEGERPQFYAKKLHIY